MGHGQRRAGRAAGRRPDDRAAPPAHDPGRLAAQGRLVEQRQRAHLAVAGDLLEVGRLQPGENLPAVIAVAAAFAEQAAEQPTLLLLVARREPGLADRQRRQLPAIVRSVPQSAVADAGERYQRLPGDPGETGKDRARRRGADCTPGPVTGSGHPVWPPGDQPRRAPPIAAPRRRARARSPAGARPGLTKTQSRIGISITR